MPCRLPDDGPAGLDQVLCEPEAEGRAFREQEVLSVLVSSGACGWGRGCCEQVLVQLSSPQGRVDYQSWLASTFHLMVPSPLLAYSKLGLGAVTRWI